MWLSKKKFQQLEKRIADLEVQVQSQQKKNINILLNGVELLSSNSIREGSIIVERLKSHYAKV